METTRYQLFNLAKTKINLIPMCALSLLTTTDILSDERDIVCPYL